MSGSAGNSSRHEEALKSAKCLSAQREGHAEHHGYRGEGIKVQRKPGYPGTTRSDYTHPGVWPSEENLLSHLQDAG